MIIVEYYPAGEASPLPNGSRTHSFSTFDAFKEWVRNYVCIHCLVDFKEFAGRNPETIGDCLDMGCGCEIGITDETNMIVWNTKMALPENFEEMRNGQNT